MSQSESPAEVPEGQPNPVLVGPGLKALNEQAYTKATSATPAVETDAMPSYFNNVPGDSPVDSDPTDISKPVQTARKASSGMELLRRLSLTSDAPTSPETDPRVQHPGLRLSGRLISAAFCIPYKIGFRSGSDWVREGRRFYIGSH
jgi:trehalose 6-phosphate synthase/phosphatase